MAKKGVAAHGARRINDSDVRKHAALSKEMVGSLLVIPMRDADGALCSLQFINEDGTKRPLPSGKQQACYYAIGKPDGVLCIVEGFATGATVHEATGHAVAVAFSAGGLKPVALALREKLPDDTRIVVCADDDWKTGGNPGLTKAAEAALSAKCGMAIPNFGEGHPIGCTDFNDLAVMHGADAVRAAIAKALTGAAAECPAPANPGKAPSMPENEEAKASLSPAQVEERIQYLAKISLIEYDRVREQEAKRLHVRVATLDAEIRKRRAGGQETSGIDFDEVTPWQVTPSCLNWSPQSKPSSFALMKLRGRRPYGQP